MYRSLLVVPMCLSAVLSAQTEPAPALRLSGNASPARYRLFLSLDPTKDTFSGTIDIDLRVTRPTQSVWLHARDLDIKSTALELNGKPVATRIDRGGADLLGITTDTPVAGAPRLRIAFEGKVEPKNPRGIFRRAAGQDRYLYTQFESIDARRAFPCFDEPSYKVPWTITLEVPRHLRAFANTPIAREQDTQGDTKTIEFTETKPLPSYLIAFAVGPFEVVDLGRAGRNKTPLRLIVPRGRADRVAFARDFTPRAFEALENYFNIPYPYAALDQIEMTATPGFAMENAGLITYGEGNLTAPPQGMSANQQRTSALVITHEMAHQWFGDLVTTAWWDDIWLNEAFATWSEAKILEQLRPDWRSTVSAQRDKRNSVGFDLLPSARRIRQPIENVGDIAHAFDPITYNKGAAVISMFENYLGPAVFRRGVQKYIDSHSHSNATASDFLRALSAAAGMDIAPAFSTFLDRVGVPLLTVSLDCSTPRKPVLTVRQERLVPVGANLSGDASWKMPLCVHYRQNGTEHRQCHLLTSATEKIELTRASSCPAIVAAGEQGASYYVVRYTGDLARILGRDGSAGLPLVERVALLQDVLTLLNSGRIDGGEALRVARDFSTGPEWELINTSAAIISSVNRLVPDKLRPNYARFVRETFGPLARQLGWRPQPAEPEERQLLRRTILPLVAIGGQDEATAKEALTLAGEWLEGKLKYDQTLVAGIISAAAVVGGRTLFDQLSEAAAKLPERSDRQLAANALADFPDPALARAALNWYIEADHAQLATFMPQRMDAHNATRRLPWTFMLANFDVLTAKMPSFMTSVPGVELIFWGWNLCTAEDRAEAERFFEAKFGSEPEAQRPLAQVRDRVSLCIARTEVLEPSVAKFLQAY
jgi:cytosol alanyl aminopeptidase